MKEEMERLNKLVDWYKFKLDEIREAPVDSRPRKLENYIKAVRRINSLEYPLLGRNSKSSRLSKNPPELKLHEYEDGPAGPRVAVQPHNEEDVFYNSPTASSWPAGCKPYNQLNYFKKIIRAYQGRDEDAVNMLRR